MRVRRDGIFLRNMMMIAVISLSRLFWMKKLSLNTVLVANEPKEQDYNEEFKTPGVPKTTLFNNAQKKTSEDIRSHHPSKTPQLRDIQLGNFCKHHSLPFSYKDAQVQASIPRFLRAAEFQ
jgi:hypothetical protein